MNELQSTMGVVKPNSIKTVGLVIAILSILVIIGNSMGGIVFTAIGAKNVLNQANSEEIPKGLEMILFLFNHYVELCLFMISLGACFLIGGINLRKYKLWANRLISLASIGFICVIWGLMVAFFSVFLSAPNEIKYVSFFAIFVAIVWSTPFVFLIRYLNRNDIKVHFE